MTDPQPSLPFSQQQQAPTKKAAHGKVFVRAPNDRIEFHITATPKQVHFTSFMFLMDPTGKKREKKGHTKKQVTG